MRPPPLLSETRRLKRLRDHAHALTCIQTTDQRFYCRGAALKHFINQARPNPRMCTASTELRRLSAKLKHPGAPFISESQVHSRAKKLQIFAMTFSNFYNHLRHNTTVLESTFLLLQRLKGVYSTTRH